MEYRELLEKTGVTHLAGIPSGDGRMPKWLSLEEAGEQFRFEGNGVYWSYDPGLGVWGRRREPLSGSDEAKNPPQYVFIFAPLNGRGLQSSLQCFFGLTEEFPVSKAPKKPDTEGTANWALASVKAGTARVVRFVKSTPRAERFGVHRITLEDRAFYAEVGVVSEGGRYILCEIPGGFSTIGLRTFEFNCKKNGGFLRSYGEGVPIDPAD